jgi:hypothetical protein
VSQCPPWSLGHRYSTHRVKAMMSGVFFIHVARAVSCYETPIFGCADGPVGEEMGPFGDDVSTERSIGNGRDERANNALDCTGIGGVLLGTLRVLCNQNG